jgi:hypothetical protein
MVMRIAIEFGGINKKSTILLENPFVLNEKVELLHIIHPLGMPYLLQHYFHMKKIQKACC